MSRPGLIGPHDRRTSLEGPCDSRTVPGTNHFILTRFNLPTPGVESRIRARDGWLRERVELFERYCAPSVARQRQPGLDWIVYFDPNSPEWLVERLRPLVEDGVFHPVYRRAVSTADLVSDLCETVKDKGEVLITTNLDNDDGLAPDFVQRLASVRTDQPRVVVYVSCGLVKSTEGLYLRTDRRNAFVLVREGWDQPVTSWSEYHNEFPRIMPAITIGGPPGWLQVIHGSNVSNRVRGRLVAPSRYRPLFGEMLEDVPEPRVLDLGADRLLRAPARTVRDGTRAAARRTALRVLGKEGYTEAKLKLASLRRSR